MPHSSPLRPVLYVSKVAATHEDQIAGYEIDGHVDVADANDRIRHAGARLVLIDIDADSGEALNLIRHVRVSMACPPAFLAVAVRESRTMMRSAWLAGASGFIVLDEAASPGPVAGHGTTTGPENAPAS